MIQLEDANFVFEIDTQRGVSRVMDWMELEDMITFLYKNHVMPADTFQKLRVSINNVGWYQFESPMGRATIYLLGGTYFI